MNDPASTPWGVHRLADGEALLASLGPLDLRLERRGPEIVVASTHPRGPLDPAFEILPAAERAPAGAAITRLVAAADAPVELVPRAADLGMVARGETSLRLFAGQRLTTYVSTPAWVEVRAGGAHTERVAGLPSHTWFGPDTLSGEVCWASSTFFRSDVASLLPLAHRIRTAIEVVNEAASPLDVARVRLPMPQLAVHRDPEGRLWTPDVRLVRTEHGDAQPSRVEVVGGSPATWPVVGPARETGEGKLSLRDVLSILG